MEFHERLSEILSQKKKSENLSDSEVARRMGVQRQVIYDWKKGRSKPSVEKIPALAAAINVPASYFLGEKQPEIIDITKWVKLKIIGKVPAGVALEAIEEYEGEIIVPPEDAKPGYFALKVQGESMHPRVLSGDVVVVAPNLEPQNGQVVVTRVNGEGEVTLKEFQRDGETILLVPENKAFQTKVFRPGSDLKIVGVVVSLQRRRV